MFSFTITYSGRRADSRLSNVKPIDELKEKKKLEYEKAKLNGKCDIVTCECGGTYQFRAKSRHFKTTKHLQYLN